MAYHGVAAEWLCLMNMESCCISKLWCGEEENQYPRPPSHSKISLSYNGELYIKVLMGASKDSIAYRTVKILVDNYKTQKVEKHRFEHPEEQKEIPKSIVLDCKSAVSATTKASVKSSNTDEVKFVNKSANRISFSKFYFVAKEVKMIWFLQK